MSDTDAFVLADIAAYAAQNSLTPDELQLALIAETKQLGGISRMQIGALQGAFMSVLTAALSPQFAVEIGTFTGYSSLAVARYLPPNGRMLCCDISQEWTAIAKRYWAQAGVDDKIELRLAPALDTLAGRTGPGLADYPLVDLAFIDADKTNYTNYYEALIPRLSPRGVILVDNVLWSGQVLDNGETSTDTSTGASTDTAALRSFNEYVKSDSRVHAVMLPIGDGLTMITLVGDTLMDDTAAASEGQALPAAAL